MTTPLTHADRIERSLKRLGFRLSRTGRTGQTGRTFRIMDTAVALAVNSKPAMSLAEIESWIAEYIKAMKDARSRAYRIRAAVAAKNAAWDGATKRRADAEYALEQFEESSEFDGSSERFDTLAKAVHKAREEERAANRAWREAVERAERDVV